MAFALLFAACFPFRAGGLQADFGLVCGWVALLPLALLVRDLPPRRAFAWAAASAWLGFSGVLFWIYVVVAVHGGAAPAVAVLAVLGLAATQAVHVGFAAALARALEGRAGPLAVLVLPACWVVFEHLRGVVPFGGFPWAFLGYSAHHNGPIRELAAFGGVYGISFAQASFACLLSRVRWRELASAIGLGDGPRSRLFRAADPRLYAAMVVLAALHATGFLWGIAQLRAAASGGEGPAHRVAIVQGNIPQGMKWDPGFADESFQAHVETSRLAAAATAVDLIVWPEAAITVPLELGRYREQVSALARETGALLLLGGLAVETSVPDSTDPADYHFYNSAHVVGPDGRYLDRYDKSQLVPFGEYLPLRSLLGVFVEALARGAALADITPGSGPRALEGVPGYGSDHALTPLICYEVIYPSLVRAAVRDGARVLVNVTNDAWYGRSSGPHQFLAIAALRSAEHGLPMIRAANTGVSAIVAPGGRVVDRTPIFERRALTAALPEPRAGATPYTRFGDWVVWLCWAGIGAIGGKGLVARRREGDPGRAEGSG